MWVSLGCGPGGARAARQCCGRAPGAGGRVNPFGLIDPDYIMQVAFPGGSVVKNPPANAGDAFDPWVGKIPWLQARTLEWVAISFSNA